jgi:hypothetical protein
VAFRPDGRLASGGQDGRIRVWDPESGRRLLDLGGHHGSVLCLTFSPAGDLVSAGDDGLVRVWACDSGDLRFALRGHRKAVRCLAFSPDGQYLASGGDDQRIKLWDLATRMPLRELREGAGSVHSVAFGQNGRLASVATDRVVKVWDTSTGQQLITLSGDESVAPGVAFGPDGRRLVSCGPGQRLKVWDARTLTAELAADREALCLLGHLCGQSATLPQLLDRIRADRTIPGPVRHHAVEVAAPYWQGSLRRDADDRIRALAASGLPRPDILSALRESTRLSDAVRHEAFAQAEHYVENPAGQHTFSRSVVRHPDRSLSAYGLAVRQAEAACRLCPNNRDYLVTLGMARSRVGEHEEALRTLERACRLFSGTANEPPALLAFLAMTQHRLGKGEQAQVTLARLRETMRQPRWATDQEAKALEKEAEKLLAGGPK